MNSNDKPQPNAPNQANETHHHHHHYYAEPPPPPPRPSQPSGYQFIYGIGISTTGLFILMGVSIVAMLILFVVNSINDGSRSWTDNINTTITVQPSAPSIPTGATIQPSSNLGKSPSPPAPALATPSSRKPRLQRRRPVDKDTGQN